MLRSLQTLVILLTTFSASAQITIKGKIIDRTSSAPIAGAHIYTINAGTYSKFDGTFELLINESDSVFISHVAYENLRYLFAKNELALVIRLKHEEHLLDPFIVHHLPAMEQFKQEIINTRIANRDLDNANMNMARIKQQYRYGYIPEMNAMDNFKEYIKGPKGVTLFSTSSSKGLVGALKNGNYYSLDREETAFKNTYKEFFPFTRSRVDSARRLHTDST